MAPSFSSPFPLFVNGHYRSVTRTDDIAEASCVASPQDCSSKQGSRLFPSLHVGPTSQPLGTPPLVLLNHPQSHPPSP